MAILDLLLLITIAMGIPLYSYLSHIAFQSQTTVEDQNQRLKSYNESFWLLGISTSLIMLVWWYTGKPIALLGLNGGTGIAFYGSLAFAISASIVLALQVVQIRRNPDARAKLKAYMEKQTGVNEFMPKSLIEHRRFNYLSVVAGITEEIIFRGFLIWAFSFWMNIWFAALLSLAVFVASHLYQQSASALIKVALAGAAMTALYLISGSLIPSIILHIALDVGTNESLRATFQPKK